MTFLNFALRYHKDIDHWMIYRLKDVCEMCRRNLNHFSWINIVPCGVVADVNVNFDMWIAWHRQMHGCLILWQNDRVINLSITHDYLVPSLSFSVSMSSGISNLNLASVTSNFPLVFASLMVPLHKVWNSFKAWYCGKKSLINFNIITRNYCLNKTSLIFVVAFLLSDSIKKDKRIKHLMRKENNPKKKKKKKNTHKKKKKKKQRTGLLALTIIYIFTSTMQCFTQRKVDKCFR